MTKDEIMALIAIINRVPVTPAETMWLNALIKRLLQDAESPAAPATPDPAGA